jgi:hypothetical protein
VFEKAEYARVSDALQQVLLQNAWGQDLDWIRDGKLVGYDPGVIVRHGDRHYGGQRGLHYPQPPLDDPSQAVGSPG